MKDHITKKDILITAGVFIVAFVGIPFLLWELSNLRLERHRKEAEPHVQEAIAHHSPNATNLARAFFQAKGQLQSSFSQELETQSALGWFVETLPRGTTAPRFPFSGSTSQAIQNICEGLRSNLPRYLEAFYMTYAADDTCSFIFQEKDDYLQMDIHNITHFSDTVDLEYLKKLKDSPEGTVSIHRDKRTLHIFTLVQKEPFFAWQLRLQQQDQ